MAMLTARESKMCDDALVRIAAYLSGAAVCRACWRPLTRDERGLCLPCRRREVEESHGR